jgi:hypothetical protein
MKGKVSPRTDHDGPEEKQRCHSTLFLTSALDGDGRATPRPGRFAPRETDVVSIAQEVG